MANPELLKGLYLFSELTDDELNLVGEACAMREYEGGDAIFHEGDPAISMYIVEIGRVGVYMHDTYEGKRVEIAQVKAKEHMGEMSFIDGEARSASCAALEDTVLMEINYSKLFEILKSNHSIASKFYHQMTCFLAKRLRLTTENLNRVNSEYMKA